MHWRDRAKCVGGGGNSGPWGHWYQQMFVVTPPATPFSKSRSDTHPPGKSIPVRGPSRTGANLAVLPPGPVRTNPC